MSIAGVTDRMLLDEPRIKQRTTPEQLQFYTQFCEKHPELLERGYRRSKEELWSNLTKSLNAMNGPTRSTVVWKELLSRWKSQLRCSKKRMGSIKRLGDGPRSANVTEFEQQTLETGADAVDGVQKIEAIGCKVNSNSQHESEVSSFQNSAMLDDEEAQTADTCPTQNPRTAVEPDIFKDHSANSRKVSFDNMFTAAMEAMRQRNDRVESDMAERAELTRAINRMCNQQEQVANALQQMNRSVMAMTQAVEKLSDLGNFLYEDYHLFK